MKPFSGFKVLEMNKLLLVERGEALVLTELRNSGYGNLESNYQIMSACDSASSKGICMVELHE